MDFPTMYNKYELQPPVYSNPGSNEVMKYSSKADASGHIEVFEDGCDYDIQEYIDSWADSVDIAKLIARFERGEETVLNRIKGVYGDFTNMPKDLAEYYNRMEEGRKFFMKLDPELRDQFNQNPLEFFQQFGTDEFYKKIKDFDDTHRPIEQTPISKFDEGVMKNE